MWKPLEINHLQVENVNLDSIMSSKFPVIVIHNYYDEKECHVIVNRIKNHSLNKFQNGKLRHIGPFLMSYTTNKEKYFEDALQSQIIFEKMFCGIKNPIMQIYKDISNIFPNYSISIANEFQNGQIKHHWIFP